MRNRSTTDFMGLWEQFNNPGFNSIKFNGIKNMAGSNSFSLTPKFISTSFKSLVESLSYQIGSYRIRYIEYLSNKNESYRIMY